MADAHQKKHDYHIIDPSPWPLLASIGAFVLAFGGIGYMRYLSGGAFHLFGMNMANPWVFFIGLLITLFVGVGMLFRDMERRTVQVTLSTPTARWEYVLGKYAGLAAAITLNTLLMALALAVALLARGAFEPRLLVAVFSLWIELLFLVAAAVFFCSFATPIFASLFTAATYVVGHLLWSLPLLEQRLEPGAFRSLVHAAYLLLPNLEFGDFRTAAVHGLPIDPGRVAGAALYELTYAAVLLGAACLAFRRRDLV